MQPLTPDDLLIRPSPVDSDRWLRADVLGAKPESPVALENFQRLEQVIRDSPINVEPYLELARIYLHSCRWTDARRVLEHACNRFSDNEEANFLREEAQIARSLQLLSEAECEYRLEPTLLTEESLARCRMELNVLREKVCRARLERHPEKIELNLPLATALNNLGQRDEAIHRLMQAVAHPQLRAAASLQMGQVFELAKRIPEALSAYRKSALFRVPPATPEIRFAALSAAADLAERSNLIDSARRYVELLIEMRPADADLRTRHAELCKRTL